MLGALFRLPGEISPDTSRRHRQIFCKVSDFFANYLQIKTVKAKKLTKNNFSSIFGQNRSPFDLDSTRLSAPVIDCCLISRPDICATVARLLRRSAQDQDLLPLHIALQADGSRQHLDLST